MRRLALVVILCCFWFVVSWGCSGETDPIDPSTTSTSGSGAGSYDGGPHDGSDDAPVDSGPPVDGGQTPVYIGLTPNAVGPDGGTPTAADIAMAELTALAAGVRAVVVDLPWAELDPNDLSALTARVDSHRERGQEVVLALLVVDGNVAHRPPALDGLAWDDPAVQLAMDSLLDGIVTVLGDKLHGLVIGRQADTYLSFHSAEAAALQTFITLALTHLKQTSPDLLRAAGLSFVGLESPPSYQTLASLGSCLALVYFPGLGEAPLPADTSPAKDLDEMIELAADRPILLQAVALGTAATLGSSDEAQLLFFEAFFAALEPRRASFPVINVHQLHDLVGAACDAQVVAQGYSPGDPFADYLCTSGLRVDPQSPKAAWYGFLEASAQFATP
ncbi:MAG: hypothetical protein DRI90_13960 [Deltaproteobacteria bacterium]|nr:MAG: hypothetical protein DRI90_13960 [Deltaproteobacteria bacterium]